MAIVDTETTQSGPPSTESSNVQPQTIDDERNLPGVQRQMEVGQINWLGSSYSGTDIKVVAHLYGEIDRQEELSKIENELETINDAANGLLTLSQIISGLTSQAVSANYPTEADFVKAGFVEPGSRASSIIAGWYSQALARPTGAANAMFAESNNLKDYSEGLRQRLSSLQQLLEASSSTQVLATLQTLSIQSHREKYPVRALGTSYVKGYTRGPRTIAGTMIFTVFNQHVLKNLIRNMGGLLAKYGELDYRNNSMLPDQLPPLDLTIAFVNEYGSRSRMTIYGVEFVNDGVTYSIEDLLSEQVISYVARDVDIMTDHGMVKLTKYEKGMFGTNVGEIQDLNASDLAFSTQDSYDKYTQSLGLQRRFKNR